MAFRNMTTWFLFSALRLPRGFAPGHPVLAQLQPVRDGFGSALALVFMVGFFWGVLKIWAGANAISKGDARARAASSPGSSSPPPRRSWRALFTIFGLQDAS
jgi:hypothetical protein